MTELQQARILLSSASAHVECDCEDCLDYLKRIDDFLLSSAKKGHSTPVNPFDIPCEVCGKLPANDPMLLSGAHICDGPSTTYGRLKTQ